jgi:hypothetical protein
MNNHVRLLPKPAQPDGIPRLMRTFACNGAGLFNDRHGHGVPDFRVANDQMTGRRKRGNAASGNTGSDARSWPVSSEAALPARRRIRLALIRTARNSIADSIKKFSGSGGDACTVPRRPGRATFAGCRRRRKPALRAILRAVRAQG